MSHLRLTLWVVCKKYCWISIKKVSFIIDNNICKDKLTLHNPTTVVSMPQSLLSQAVVFDTPGKVAVQNVSVKAPGVTELVVDVSATGISTGTEKLLWNGTMPVFPGLKYPLVPGYEAVGTVVKAGPLCETPVGSRVFVPGASCYRGDVRGLFGASASRLVTAESRAWNVGNLPDEESVLLALAATAMHILTHQIPTNVLAKKVSSIDEVSGRRGAAMRARLAAKAPQLIVGHGTLGRLLARLCVAVGASAPVVWECNPARRDAPSDGSYTVVSEANDERRDYSNVCDVSGAGGALFDSLITRLTRGGHVTLGGFYSGPIEFQFAPAFMREIQLSVAAEWRPHDMMLVMALLRDAELSLEGLISNTESASRAHSAYKTAFEDKECLKMMLNWSTL